MQLRELKQFNPDSGDLEVLVEMLSYGQMIRGTYQNLEDDGVEAPEWLDGKLKRIRREIIAKHDDILRKKLADAKLRVESFKTPQEKKREAQAEIKRLQALVASQD